MPSIFKYKIMNKRDNIIYIIATALFSLMLFGGAITYFVNYEMTSEMFTQLGVPTEIIYPLAVAKILGVIAICFIRIPMLKSLAYLGFALDLILAMAAHLNAGDDKFYGPILPLLLLSVSYIFYRKKLKA